MGELYEKKEEEAKINICRVRIPAHPINEEIIKMAMFNLTKGDEAEIDMLQKKLEKEGIASDTVDVRAHFDPTLTYWENWEIIKEKAGISHPQNEMEQMQSDISRLTKEKQKLEEQLEKKPSEIIESPKQVAIIEKNVEQQVQKISAMNRIRGYINRKLAEREAVKNALKKKAADAGLNKTQQEKFLSEAMRQGLKSGYRHAYKKFGGELARIQIMKQQMQPSFTQQVYSAMTGQRYMTPMQRQAVQLEVWKQRQALMAKMEAERQLSGMRMQYERNIAMRKELQRRAHPPRRIPQAKFKGQPQVLIPPHVHQASMITGRCRICGIRMTRIL